MVDNQFQDSDNAETRRMVELAKQQEARTAASMGYNPYEARLMGNTVRNRVGQPCKHHDALRSSAPIYSEAKPFNTCSDGCVRRLCGSVTDVGAVFL